MWISFEKYEKHSRCKTGQIESDKLDSNDLPENLKMTEAYVFDWEYLAWIKAKNNIKAKNKKHAVFGFRRNYTSSSTSLQNPFDLWNLTSARIVWLG